MSTSEARIQGITEDDIANYLANTPGFFERHAELLASVTLASPHSHRAVSLQQRQMELLRERIKGLERRLMEMIRHGHENAAITERLHAWTLTLMAVSDPLALPGVLTQSLRERFLVPQAALRVWGVAEHYAEAEFATGASDSVRQLTEELAQPYCGAPPDELTEALQWLPAPAELASTALIPLRDESTGDDAGACFGLLVLGSPDPTRYAADMATDFLARIGQTASVALGRLRPDAL